MFLPSMKDLLLKAHTLENTRKLKINSFSKLQLNILNERENKINI